MRTKTALTLPLSNLRFVSPDVPVVILVRIKTKQRTQFVRSYHSRQDSGSKGKSFPEMKEPHLFTCYVNGSTRGGEGSSSPVIYRIGAGYSGRPWHRDCLLRRGEDLCRRRVLLHLLSCSPTRK